TSKALVLLFIPLFRIPCSFLCEPPPPAHPTVSAWRARPCAHASTPITHKCALFPGVDLLNDTQATQRRPRADKRSSQGISLGGSCARPDVLAQQPTTTTHHKHHIYH